MASEAVDPRDELAAHEIVLGTIVLHEAPPDPVNVGPMWHPRGMSTSPRHPPRYLRFVRGLALGALVATTGCGDDDGGTGTDASVVADAGMDASVVADAGMDASVDAAPPDAGPVDSGPPDANVTVDGPLHPPDLPRRSA